MTSVQLELRIPPTNNLETQVSCDEETAKEEKSINGFYESSENSLTRDQCFCL